MKHEKDLNIAAALAAEAEEVRVSRAHGKGHGPLHRGRRAAKPAQVYALRMPAERLEQLRQLADQEGETPSALMRNWVLERLDLEASGKALDERMRRAVRVELERAGLTSKVAS
jgi:aryl-alcohol dehydrogenase-like predicted oxidoreductase